MTQRPANIAFSSVLIVACIILINLALNFDDASSTASSELSSGFFPIAVLTFIIISCLFNIGIYLKANTEKTKEDYVDLNSTQLIRVALGFISLLAAYFVWEYFGFMVMATFLVIAISVIMATRSKTIYVFLLLLGPALFFIFDKGLQITLQ